MAYCPECKVELKPGDENCFVCGTKIEDDLKKAWIVIGLVGDKISADFVKATLESQNIPVVVISKSGFFGTVGLPLVPFYSPDSAKFEVSVPVSFAEEAQTVCRMTLGEKWQEKEG